MAKFEKGHQKIGGRKKGSKNKATVLRAESVMAEMGYNPVREMILQTRSENIPEDIKAKLHMELNALINAKPKAKEIEPTPEPTEDPDLSGVSTADLLQLVKKP